MHEQIAYLIMDRSEGLQVTRRFDVGDWHLFARRLGHGQVAARCPHHHARAALKEALTHASVEMPGIDALA
ncbi:hypothetical protein [Paraburkholderia elongata]|uniref:Uncharacterized protein n=1 Tax=Paraburkholderia elongata TaxID=2675747 RepID=A0A972NYY6_9BURK|nr:hypothetical protein [Paraburkholderia elongata]NPT61043.1 hypothetical protein [Paraburkholderia elongata]